jgi:hypothetical protein
MYTAWSELQLLITAILSPGLRKAHVSGSSAPRQNRVVLFWFDYRALFLK